MAKTPERFIWASKVINLKNDESVLEIGCGAGLLLEELGKKYSKGHLKGIDKSEHMIKLAKKRNKDLIKKGITSLENLDFIDLKSKEQSYDKIIAFNVNFFLKNSEKELALLKRMLKPEGKIYVFYQAPFEIDMKFASPIIENFTINSFSITRKILKKMNPTPSLCIIAKKYESNKTK